MSAVTFELKFADELEGEIREIFQWYSTKSSVAAKKFIESLDESFQFLSMNPHSFPKQRKNFRMASVRKFPFVIIYEITGSIVLILRIIHSSRRPGKRFEKLRER